MFGVVEADHIRSFENKPAIVATFVATGWDQKIIKWMLGAWEQFNIDFEDRWHLLVPTSDWVEGGGFANWERIRFNPKLAKDFADIYGLARSQVPAIVFDNYNDEEKQEVISLRDAGEPDLRSFFETCCGVMNEHPYKNQPISKYRREVIGSIKNKVEAGRAGSLLMKKTPIFGSIFRLASGLPNF